MSGLNLAGFVVEVFQRKGELASLWQILSWQECAVARAPRWRRFRESDEDRLAYCR